MHLSNIQWVVQKNLTNKETLDKLEEACKNIGVGHVELEVIPFTNKLPEFPKEKFSTFYGSTTLNQLIYEDKELKRGLFYDDRTFSMDNYFSKWGVHMLNFGAKITTFETLIHLPQYKPDDLLFIRPDGDTKSFIGEVKEYKAIQKWYESLLVYENANLNLKTKIIVGNAYNIDEEWRLWVVKGNIVASSRYRKNFRLAKQAGCPKEIKQFAESMCKRYMPHDVFVMDIGTNDNTPYIIECGCVNAAGFYNADVSEVVYNVSNYFVDSLLR